MLNWQDRALKLKAKGHSGRTIAEMIGRSKSAVNAFLRKQLESESIPASELAHDGLMASQLEVGTILSEGGFTAYPRGLIIRNAAGEVILESGKEHINQRILFISDMHIPYHNKGLLPFLQALKDKYNPTRVICLGDELDKHALSYHDSDPDLDSAGPELLKSRPVIAKLKAMFPVMDIIDSNHGSLVWRKAKTHGIPRAYIRSYNDVMEVDEGWTWHFDMTLELPDGQQVYVHHGKNSSAIKVAQTIGMSHVCGHYHESFGIQYYSTPNKLLWGMNAGCLIDRKSLAFAYSNNNLKRPVLGTGLIIDGKPVLEPMVI